MLRITIILFLLIVELSQSFRPTLSRRFVPTHLHNKVPSSSFPEYSSVREDTDDEETEQTPIPKHQPQKHKRPSPKKFFAALEPGTVVQIQVGDVTQARKAWKKRRRSGSPLLVPCSVLSVDRQATIRWNLLYLLEKFGASTLAELAARHKSHLASSLTHQAQYLGYDTPHALVQALFPKQVQEAYGVEYNDESLRAPGLSRRKARQRASRAVILQVQDNDDDQDALLHTGIVRCRNTESDRDASSFYTFQSLSAALRVSAQDVMESGSLHAAVVFDFDATGDAGGPLLTLSLNPSRNRVRDRLKLTGRSEERITHPRHVLSELNVGEGPIEGRVARFVKGGALVDCGVGRPSTGDSMIKVYGLLKFQDAILEQTDISVPYLEDDDDDDNTFDDQLDQLVSSIDDLDTMTFDDDDEVDAESHEEVEDITHLFEMNSDGSLSYRDPETGETSLISLAEDDEENEDKDDSEEEEEEKDTIIDDSFIESEDPSELTLQEKKYTTANRKRSRWLRVGDQVDVFVKGISKQSGQFQVTLDKSIKGKNAKELKKEGDIHKRLDRLSKQLGGLDRVENLRGRSLDGVVKAASKTGDWFYVQPSGVENLPVGVATVSDDAARDIEEGDSVRIRIEGIDEDRGQLAMIILE